MKLIIKIVQLEKMIILILISQIFFQIYIIDLQLIMTINKRLVSIIILLKYIFILLNLIIFILENHEMRSSFINEMKVIHEYMKIIDSRFDRLEEQLHIGSTHQIWQQQVLDNEFLSLFSMKSVENISVIELKLSDATFEKKLVGIVKI